MAEEQSTQEAPQSEQPESEQQPASSESTPQQTPPTEQPTAGPTDQYARILEATLKDMNAQNRALQQQLDNVHRGVASGPPAPPAKSQDELRNDFFNDPHGSTRNIIREEMQATIKPLMDVVQGLRFEGSPFNNMLSQFKTDPRFGPHITPDVEQAINKLMGQAELTPQNMQAAVVQAIGLKASGLLGVALGNFEQPTNNPPPPQHNNHPPAAHMTTPPHIRTSGPPPAGPNNNQPALRPLTENEETLRRHNRQTHAEFLAWLDAPASTVASSQIGKKDWKPTGGK